MTAVPVVERMTAEEFLELPKPKFWPPWSLIDGEVVMTDATEVHNAVSLNLVYALESWVRAAPGRGRAAVPLAIGIDEHNVYKPDVLWYSDETSRGLEGPPPYPVPDLAVEVRSPSTWRYDIGAKKSGYERGGLAELWLVDTTADQVLVFRRSGPKAHSFDVSLELNRDQQITSPLLPGFALPLAEVFPER